METTQPTEAAPGRELVPVAAPAVNNLSVFFPTFAPGPASGTKAIAALTAPLQAAFSPWYSESAGGEVFRTFDRMRQAFAAQGTGGFSPVAGTLAFYDWFAHLAAAPGKRMELAWKAGLKASRLAAHLATGALTGELQPVIEAQPGDFRFSAEGWKLAPYNFLEQSFLLTQQWWHRATHDVPGVSPHNEEVVSFAARQILDLFSPSNNPLTNPEVVAKAMESGGANFVQGYRNWLEDLSRQVTGKPPVGAEKFRPGEEVAVTPGKVIFRNHLIELIQYSPTQPSVFAEPVLIVPAWIMKYYILDLSPHNSLVRFLVDHGHTVFCISWRNPGAEDRDISFDDYRSLGVMAAIDAIGEILPQQRIHATGYCLGGTLLSIAAAAMARRKDQRLASVTLFAAQTDFSEPGELALFIDPSQVNYLDSMMWNRGYLSSDQMAGTFQLLHSNDLIWSRMVHEYLMGVRPPMSDLMAWNADSTRMPYRMHAEYLKRLYLDNDLASARFIVDGHPAALQNIRVPMFVVGTERDHVAPWKSVFKIHHLTETDLSFVLTSGGHNAGIVSEPDHPHRHYRLALKQATDICLSPEEWLATVNPTEGSWWPAWQQWLAGHSTARRVPPPAMGNPARGLVPLDDAPGSYVFQR